LAALYVSGCVTLRRPAPFRIAFASKTFVGLIAVVDCGTSWTEAPHVVPGAATSAGWKKGPPLGAQFVVPHTRGFGTVGVPPAPTLLIAARAIDEML
jgi:hypothetical protein